MATQYGALTLTEIVMHQITRTRDDSEHRFQTLLTDEPVELDAADRDFLTRRFVKVLSGRGLPIIEDADTASPVPSATRGMWFPQPDFIELSKVITHHLADVQPGSALEGLLVIARGHLNGDDLTIIAKVEHQEAMRLEPIVNDAGHQIFEVERLTDLVFGDTARIYKIAILSRAQSATGVLSGEIVDEQNGLGFAAYFLSKFMGMRLREEPAVLTERFLDAMSAAINRSTMAPEKRLDVQAALVAELNSNSSRVNPTTFLQNHVPAGHGSELKQLAVDEGATMVQFAKDTGRIKGRIARLRLDMSNDVHIIAPPDSVGPDKPVSISEVNGSDVVTISGGRLNSIRPSGGR